MPEKQYLILLDRDARKRHYHVTESGRIVKFVVQLEVRLGSEWKEVIRYDCAHGFVHKDFYNKEGQRRKMSLSLDYSDGLTFANDDINDNWEVYREKYLRGEFP